MAEGRLHLTAVGLLAPHLTEANAEQLIAAASGLGYWILDAEEMARIDVVFAGIIVIGGLGILLDRAAYWAVLHGLPWIDVRAQWQA